MGGYLAVLVAALQPSQGSRQGSRCSLAETFKEGLSRWCMNGRLVIGDREVCAGLYVVTLMPSREKKTRLTIQRAVQIFFLSHHVRQYGSIRWAEVEKV